MMEYIYNPCIFPTIPNKNSFDYKWIQQYRLLNEYYTFFGHLPKNSRNNQTKQHDRLLRWLKYQRRRNKSNTLKGWKKEYLLMLHPNIFSKNTTSKDEYVLNGQFEKFINNLPVDEERYEYKYSFKEYTQPYLSKLTKSMTEHMIKMITRPEINITDCTVNAPYGSIQRILSFLIHKPLQDNSIASLKNSIFNNTTQTSDDREDLFISSVYIEPNHIPTYLKILMDDTLENNYPTLLSQLRSTNDSNDVKTILHKNIFMFDASNSGKNGLGSKDIISLFDTTHPSPRRTSMSVTFHPPKYMPSIDCMVQRLFTYGSGGARKAIIDTRSRSMPADVARLGEECWKLVRCMLMPMTKLCPPNHCQVCLYNSKFKSNMGLHRDNGYRTSKGKLIGTTVDETSNSHIFGTEVMIVTLGDSMEFNIVPPPTNSISTFSIKDYRQNRQKKLTTILENQSIYIFTLQMMMKYLCIICNSPKPQNFIQTTEYDLHLYTDG